MGSFLAFSDINFPRDNIAHFPILRQIPLPQSIAFYIFDLEFRTKKKLNAIQSMQTIVNRAFVHLNLNKSNYKFKKKTGKINTKRPDTHEIDCRQFAAV